MYLALVFIESRSFGLRWVKLEILLTGLLIQALAHHIEIHFAVRYICESGLALLIATEFRLAILLSLRLGINLPHNLTWSGDVGHHLNTLIQISIGNTVNFFFHLS